MIQKKISVVIATFNSEKTLPLTLESLRKQSYDQNKIEILIIDGGSTDNTLSLCSECTIINNPKVEPTFAKFLGLTNASGEYILFIDSDEELVNSNSLMEKVQILESTLNCAIVISSGYSNPQNYGFLNSYINAYGDPFSCFIYNLSKQHGVFFTDLARKYLMPVNSKNVAIFNFQDISPLPMIELTTMGSLLHLTLIKRELPELFEQSHLTCHSFYLICRKFFLVGMCKNDPIYHYSSNSLRSYFGKIKSRIRNNIHFRNDLGMAGYTGRSQFDPLSFRLKRFLFMPYAFLFIPLFFHTSYIAFKRFDLRYFLHIPLTLMTATTISFEYLKKIFGIKQTKKSYGEKFTIEN
jgi:glycosyltransferase involved in cell wall biosynthesis